MKDALVIVKDNIKNNAVLINIVEIFNQPTFQVNAIQSYEKVDGVLNHILFTLDDEASFVRNADVIMSCRDKESIMIEEMVGPRFINGISKKHGLCYTFNIRSDLIFYGNTQHFDFILESQLENDYKILDVVQLSVLEKKFSICIRKEDEYVIDIINSDRFSLIPADLSRITLHTGELNKSTYIMEDHQHFRNLFYLIDDLYLTVNRKNVIRVVKIDTGEIVFKFDIGVNFFSLKAIRFKNNFLILIKTKLYNSRFDRFVIFRTYSQEEVDLQLSELKEEDEDKGKEGSLSDEDRIEEREEVGRVRVYNLHNQLINLESIALIECGSKTYLITNRYNMTIKVYQINIQNNKQALKSHVFNLSDNFLNPEIVSYYSKIFHLAKISCSESFIEEDEDNPDDVAFFFCAVNFKQNDTFIITFGVLRENIWISDITTIKAQYGSPKYDIKSFGVQTTNNLIMLYYFLHDKLRIFFYRQEPIRIEDSVFLEARFDYCFESSKPHQLKSLFMMNFDEIESIHDIKLFPGYLSLFIDNTFYKYKLKDDIDVTYCKTNLSSNKIKIKASNSINSFYVEFSRGNENQNSLCKLISIPYLQVYPYPNRTSYMGICLFPPSPL